MNLLQTSNDGISIRYDKKNGKVILSTAGQKKISYYGSSLTPNISSGITTRGKPDVQRAMRRLYSQSDTF
jgi:hypothetical protein